MYKRSILKALCVSSVCMLRGEVFSQSRPSRIENSDPTKSNYAAHERDNEFINHQLTTQNQQIRPYLQVPSVASEQSTVRVFFSPNCPFSKDYFDFFVNLSKTLPSELKFELSALPNKRDGIEYALSFLAVRRFYPNFVPNFVQASYLGFQELGLSSKSWAAIARVSRAIKLPLHLPSLVLRERTVLSKDLVALDDLCKALRVTNTPCVAVDGTYTVTPEFVAGADPAMFNQLVNSVISMTLGA